MKILKKVVVGVVLFAVVRFLTKKREKRIMNFGVVGPCDYLNEDK